VFIKLWSAAVRQVIRCGFGKKTNATILSDTERMKNTPIKICDETAFVG
jgi:hypothetical protein